MCQVTNDHGYVLTNDRGVVGERSWVKRAQACLSMTGSLESGGTRRRCPYLECRRSIDISRSSRTASGDGVRRVPVRCRRRLARQRPTARHARAPARALHGSWRSERPRGSASRLRKRAQHWPDHGDGPICRVREPQQLRVGVGEVRPWPLHADDALEGHRAADARRKSEAAVAQNPAADQRRVLQDLRDHPAPRLQVAPQLALEQDEPPDRSTPSKSRNTVPPPRGTGNSRHSGATAAATRCNRSRRMSLELTRFGCAREVKCGVPPKAQSTSAGRQRFGRWRPNRSCIPGSAPGGAFRLPCWSKRNPCCGQSIP